MKIKKIFFVFVFTFISQVIFAQQSVDQCLVKLNKIHKDGRLIFTTKEIPVIYLNKRDKIVDFGTSTMPIDKVTMAYTYQQRELPDKKYHGVQFWCVEESCIKSIDFGNTTNVSIFFKSKKNCYDFINAINDLKKALGN